MHWFVMLVLLGVAFLFAESGAFFISALAIITLLLLSFTSKSAAPAGQVVGHTQDGTPIIVKSSGAKVPSKIKVKIKDPWGGTTSFEDTARGTGEVVDTLLATAYRLFFGEHEEEDTEQNKGVRGR
ncbi:MAG: hypothetical protein WC607_01015 [Candidatus Micrarchaeia archaeon]